MIRQKAILRWDRGSKEALGNHRPVEPEHKIAHGVALYQPNVTFSTLDVTLKYHLLMPRPVVRVRMREESL